MPDTFGVFGLTGSTLWTLTIIAFVLTAVAWFSFTFEIVVVGAAAFTTSLALMLVVVASLLTTSEMWQEGGLYTLGVILLVGIPFLSTIQPD